MPERYRAAVVVAAASGLRASELFALARRHVDLSRALVLVERSLVATPDRRPMFAPPKRASERRAVHLPQPAAEALAEHLRTHAGPEPEPEALVFTTERGAMVRAPLHSRLLAQACEATGLHVHDLRHLGRGRTA